MVYYCIHHYYFNTNVATDYLVKNSCKNILYISCLRINIIIIHCCIKCSMCQDINMFYTINNIILIAKYIFKQPMSNINIIIIIDIM